MISENKMRVTVLGAGGAFASIERGNSAFLVEYADRRILIDCGTTTPYVLRDEMDIPLQSITDILLTHNHADHMGGLEQVLLACRWLGQCRPTIWCAPHVRGLLHYQLNHLRFDRDNKCYGAGFDQHAVVREGWGYGHDSWGAGWDKGPGGLPLRFVDVKHVGIMPSSGVMLGNLSISGDTREPVSDKLFWSNASLIFHEVEAEGNSGVHCPLPVLCARLREDDVRGKPVWAYHCPDFFGPGPLAGVLRKGDTFQIPVDSEP